MQKTKDYKYTVHQKNFIKRVYPILGYKNRKRLREMFFKSHYTQQDRNFLNAVGRYFRQEPGNFKVQPKIPLNEYL